MKNLKTASILLVCIFSSISLSAQVLAWANQLGGTLAESANAMATDARGNVYVTGSFEGTADFDPGSGIYNLTAGGSRDIFVAKLDANGNLLWANRFGSANWDEGKAIGISPLGYVFVAGRFADTTDFDPGAGIANLTAKQTTCGIYGVDAFVLKLDGNGNYQWAHNLGGSGADEIHALAVGPDESVHLAGFYRVVAGETVDFDPGAGSFLLSNGGMLTAEFLLKLNGSGNFVWAKQFTTTSLYAAGCLRNIMFTINALAIDASGRVHVAGEYTGNADFDPSSAVFTISTTVNNSFVLKLQANGTFVWAKAFTGGNNEILGIAVDASSRVYVTGGWTGTVDFNPSTTTTNLTSKNSNSDAFVVKLTAAGAYTWAKAIAGNQTDVGRAISVDAAGNVYTAGEFSVTTDFNPGTAKYNLISAGGTDVYVSKLSASGGFVWAKAFGGSNSDYCTGLSATPNGIYTIGNFTGTADFDPATAVYNLTSAGGADGFVQKLEEGGAAKRDVEPSELQTILVYPNPTSRYLTLQLGTAMGKATFALVDLNGRTLLTGSATLPVQEIDLHDLPAGIYLLTLNREGMSTQHVRIVKTE